MTKPNQQPIDSLAIARHFFYDEPLPKPTCAETLAKIKAIALEHSFEVVTAKAPKMTPILDCATCEHYEAHPGGPSHDGSPGCRSGSIASGGKRAHCSCALCF